MPPTSVNTIPRSAQIHTGGVLNTPSNPVADTTISLREFVVDEDAENFNSALWRTIDQNAFILAQRDALEAFNVAKALRLSKETAAAELERRQAVAVTAPPPPLPPSENQLPSSSSRHQHHGSQPIAIKKSGTSSHPQHTIASDEAIALSLARSYKAEASQPSTFLDNRSPPSSPVKPIKISPSSSSYHSQDKKAPASIAKQNSRNQLSLSTSPFSTSSSSPSAAVDSRHIRSTSQSNTFTKVPSLLLPSSNPPVSDQRSHSKREPAITEDPPVSSPSSQFRTSDVTNAKRRRTEHKPSPSLDVAVTAPPISVPQKSSTFSRNLRPGTVIPPAKDNSSPSMSTSEGSKAPPPVPPPSKAIAPPKQKAYLHNPLNDAPMCPQCGNRLTTPRIQLSTPLNSRSLCDALHTTCSSCMTRHCRGCTSISPCTRSCSAGQKLTSCAVRNCCYNVRAVVIFEALNIFDHIFATEAGFADHTADAVDSDPHHSSDFGRQQREAYIKLLISKADKSMRKFEDAFVRTLKIICSWLQFSPEDGFDADDETSPASGNPSYLNDSIPHLLLASYLPEVIHTFLSNNNVRDWLAHSDTYIMILEFLRWISDFPTLSTVLNRSLPCVQRNCTLRQWATGQGTINLLWYPSHANNPVVEAEPIGDLIKKLETHRSGLRAFAAKVQFEATLDKVNALCDGISYLLLQQVVGGF